MLLHPVGCKINDLSNIQINVSGHDIKLSDSVMNLGVCLDPSFKLSSHVNNVVKICNFHLRNLWRIRRLIDTTTCHHAVT